MIVVATESHRDSLLPRLQAHGLDIGAAIKQGRYISLDAADTLSTFMVNDQPDPVRFLKVLAISSWLRPRLRRESVPITLQLAENVDLSCGSKAMQRRRFDLNTSGTR